MMEVSSKYRTIRGSGNLRWIIRNGEKVLQQPCEYIEYENGKVVGMGMDWLDVPTHPTAETENVGGGE